MVLLDLLEGRVDRCWAVWQLAWTPLFQERAGLEMMGLVCRCWCQFLCLVHSDKSCL